MNDNICVIADMVESVTTPECDAHTILFQVLDELVRRGSAKSMEQIALEAQQEMRRSMADIDPALRAASGLWPKA